MIKLPAHLKEFSPIVDIIESKLNEIDYNKLLLIPDIDNLDGERLELVANAFHIEGYELADTLEDKRSLVKKAIELHRFKGTPYAVKEALKVLNIDALLTEWFENGGDPYTFNIKLSFEKDVKVLKTLLNLIDDYKNVRSHYTVDIDFIRNLQLTHRVNACISIDAAQNLTFTRQLDCNTQPSACVDLYSNVGFNINTEAQNSCKNSAVYDFSHDIPGINIYREVQTFSNSAAIYNIEIGG